MIKGNKGEWSELYVLFYLAANRNLYAADNNLQIINKSYFPVLLIKRVEKDGKPVTFDLQNPDIIKIYKGKKLFNSIETRKMRWEAERLLRKIKETNGKRAFAIPETETFMRSIGCSKLAASSKDKTDISMIIHDPKTSINSACGFSIKSDLGSNPTLLNASGATNFVYLAEGLKTSDIKSINSIVTGAKIKKRMLELRDKLTDGELKFEQLNDTFRRNLTFVDSQMPAILAYAVQYHYLYEGLKTCQQICSMLKLRNPLGVTDPSFYSYNFKEFLYDVALGMTPSRVWNGKEEANGGYIIVTQEGKVVAYHIYNRDDFKNYLFKNTYFDRGGSGRNKYAELYKEEGKIKIKLNLMIRFNET